MRVSEQQQPAISFIWPDVTELEVRPVNQALTQLEAGGPDGPDGILLTLGYMAPPVVLGSGEETGVMFNAIGSLPVHAYGRYSLRPQRARAIIEILQQALTQYDEAKPGVQEEGSQ